MKLKTLIKEFLKKHLIINKNRLKILGENNDFSSSNFFDISLDSEIIRINYDQEKMTIDLTAEILSQIPESKEILIQLLEIDSIIGESRFWISDNRLFLRSTKIVFNLNYAEFSCYLTNFFVSINNVKKNFLKKIKINPFSIWNKNTYECSNLFIPKSKFESDIIENISKNSPPFFRYAFLKAININCPYKGGFQIIKLHEILIKYICFIILKETKDISEKFNSVFIQAFDSSSWLRLIFEIFKNSPSDIYSNIIPTSLFSENSFEKTIKENINSFLEFQEILYCSFPEDFDTDKLSNKTRSAFINLLNLYKKTEWQEKITDISYLYPYVIKDSLNNYFLLHEISRLGINFIYENPVNSKFTSFIIPKNMMASEIIQKHINSILLSSNLSCNNINKYLHQNLFSLNTNWINFKIWDLSLAKEELFNFKNNKKHIYIEFENNETPASGLSKIFKKTLIFLNEKTNILPEIYNVSELVDSLITNFNKINFNICQNEQFWIIIHGFDYIESMEDYFKKITENISKKIFFLTSSTMKYKESKNIIQDDISAEMLLIYLSKNKITPHITKDLFELIQTKTKIQGSDYLFLLTDFLKYDNTELINNLQNAIPENLTTLINKIINSKSFKNRESFKKIISNLIIFNKPINFFQLNNIYGLTKEQIHSLFPESLSTLFQPLINNTVKLKNEKILNSLENVLKDNINSIKKTIEEEYTSKNINIVNFLSIIPRLQENKEKFIINHFFKKSSIINIFDLYNSFTTLIKLLHTTKEGNNFITNLLFSINKCINTFFELEIDRLKHNIDEKIIFLDFAQKITNPILKLKTFLRLYSSISKLSQNKKETEYYFILTQENIIIILSDIFKSNNFSLINLLFQELDFSENNKINSFLKARLISELFKINYLKIITYYNIFPDENTCAHISEKLLYKLINFYLNFENSEILFNKKLDHFFELLITSLPINRINKIYLNIKKKFNDYQQKKIYLLFSFIASNYAMDLNIKKFNEIYNEIPPEHTHKLNNTRVYTICSAAQKLSYKNIKQALNLLNRAELKKTHWDLNSRIFLIAEALIKISINSSDPSKKNVLIQAVTLLKNNIKLTNTQDKIYLVEKFVHITSHLIKIDLQNGEELFKETIHILDNIPDSGTLCSLLLKLAYIGKTFGLESHNNLFKKAVLLINSQFIPDEELMFSHLTFLSPRKAIEFINFVTEENIEAVISKVFEALDPIRYEEYGHLFLTVIESNTNKKIILQLIAALKTSLKLSVKLSELFWIQLKKKITDNDDYDLWFNLFKLFNVPAKNSIFIFPDVLKILINKAPIDLLCSGICKAFEINPFDKFKNLEIVFDLFEKKLNNNDIFENWMFHNHIAFTLKNPDVRFFKFGNAIKKLTEKIMHNTQNSINFHNNDYLAEISPFVKFDKVIEKNFNEKFNLKKNNLINSWEKSTQQFKLLAISLVEKNAKNNTYLTSIISLIADILPYINKKSAQINLARTIQPFLQKNTGMFKTKAFIIHHFLNYKFTDTFDTKKLLNGIMPNNQAEAVKPLAYIPQVIHDIHELKLRLTDKNAITYLIINLKLSDFSSYIEYCIANNLIFEIEEIDLIISTYNVIIKNKEINNLLKFYEWKNYETALTSVLKLYQISLKYNYSYIKTILKLYFLILRTKVSADKKENHINLLLSEAYRQKDEKCIVKAYKFKFLETENKTNFIFDHQSYINNKKNIEKIIVNSFKKIFQN